MSWFEIIAERKIREAQEEGVFDNVPGQGQPLNLEVDPRVPPEQRTAARLLKEARYVPEWIALENDIRRAQAAWDESVRSFEQDWRAVRSGDPQARLGRLSVEEMDRARSAFLIRAARGLRELNARIDRFNLLVPISARTRARIRAAERMQDLETRLPAARPPIFEEEPLWLDLVQEERRPTVLSNRMPRRIRRSGIG